MTWLDQLIASKGFELSFSSFRQSWENIYSTNVLIDVAFCCCTAFIYRQTKCRFFSQLFCLCTYDSLCQSFVSANLKQFFTMCACKRTLPLRWMWNICESFFNRLSHSRSSIILLFEDFSFVVALKHFRSSHITPKPSTSRSR